MDDEALAALVAHADRDLPAAQQAFETLAERYRGRLRRFLARYFRSLPSRWLNEDDLVQDVLTLLFHKLPTVEYDGTRSFRAWLRTVLLNKWRDARRRHAADPARPADHALDAAPARDEDAEEHEDRQRLVARTGCLVFVLVEVMIKQTFERDNGVIVGILLQVALDGGDGFHAPAGQL